MTADVREVLVAMVGDKSSTGRDAAVRAMDKLSLDPSEAPSLEALLTRKAGDLRRGVIRLLAHQQARHAVSSASRLWDTSNPAQRDAACELLSAIPRRPEAAQVLAGQFVAAGATEQQQELLAKVIGSATDGDQPPTAALSYRADLQTPRREPRTPARRLFATDPAGRIVSALDDLAHAHRDQVVTVINWQGSSDMLLADVRFLPSPFQVRALGPQDVEEQGRGLILPDVFRTWWDERPADCRADGRADALEALVSALVAAGAQRAFHAPDATQTSWWRPQLQKMVTSVGALRHGHVVHHVLLWMVAEEADSAVVEECLDAYETLLAAVPRPVLLGTPRPNPDNQWTWVFDWRDMVTENPWATVLYGLLAIRPDVFERDQLSRLLGLERWVDQPINGVRPRPVRRQLVQAAFKAGVATDDDVRECLLDPSSRMLKDFTRRRRQSLETEYPRIVALADELRDQVLKIERTRGELPTAASGAALCLGSVSGAGIAIELLGRLGRASLVRGWSTGQGREAVYSHLLPRQPSGTDRRCRRCRGGGQGGEGDGQTLDRAGGVRAAVVSAGRRGARLGRLRRRRLVVPCAHEGRPVERRRRGARDVDGIVGGAHAAQRSGSAGRRSRFRLVPARARGAGQPAMDRRARRSQAGVGRQRTSPRPTLRGSHARRDQRGSTAESHGRDTAPGLGAGAGSGAVAG